MNKKKKNKPLSPVKKQATMGARSPQRIFVDRSGFVSTARTVQELLDMH